MSFVMIGVVNKKICIVGDTQITAEDNVTVLDDDFKKIMKVGHNCLIGFTGKPGICSLALKNIYKLDNNLVNPYELTKVILNNFKTIYSSLNITNNILNMCQVVVGGITVESFYNDNRIFKLFSINTTENYIKEIEIKKYPEMTIVPMSNLINPATVQKIIINEFKANNKQNTKEIFESIVKEVSKRDTTVNSKPFYLEI